MPCGETGAGGESLPAIVDGLRQTAEGRSEVSVSRIIEAIGPRSHFTIILVVAAIATTPLSGIPGMSVICGLLIAIVAAERIFSGGTVRLPRWITRRSLPADKFTKTLDIIDPVVRFLDRHTRRRAAWLMHSPWNRLPLLICLVCGLTMPFLELIPFTSSIVAGGVTLIAIGMITRDGLFLFMALIPFVALIFLLTRAL
ncbi:exopolysaccharide biosynthesis protein [Paracoccus sp. TK19116]|uniref:Exopolysaccharide biosynthesis protein n=1 Tax=Paracoccus albicereus TaxID=2922394 RepID=A0ABT1MRX1_9RHOB|nr:exopolysaccharide biosynthesis protein [Paracoccus albicereus]MCQ0970474.1 exopolysaccharide biosynthesis protein [Paracoccus albicereus]